MACGGGGKAPDYAASAREGVYADLNTSPFTYLINAVAKTGGKITLDGQTYDFTGMGDADNTKVASEKMASALLDMQKKYGPAYVQQRLAELQQSDPEGQSARKQLYAATMASLDTPVPEQARTVQKLLLEEVDKGTELPEETKRQVVQGVRAGQAARGNMLGNAAVAQEGRAVAGAGQQQQDTRQQQALTYLQSGVSPEDIEYRRIQQGMANLGAFLSGTTPTAEFAGLSGAGTGAAPFIGGGTNPTTLNPNAAVQGAQNANSMYALNSAYERTQANPWLAGASMGTQAFNLYQAAKGPATYGAPAGTVTGINQSFANANVAPWGVNNSTP